MRVLIGCEYSGAVRNEFAALGHDSWSCDLLPSESAGNHIQGDVMEAIGRGWDLIMLHPPCTKIALCANKHYGRNKPRHQERVEALEWTVKLWKQANEVCGRVGLENPKNVLGRLIGKKTQTIHPWEYGHPEQKETWLWLRGLPPLVPTNIVYDEMMLLPKNERERIFHMTPSEDRGHKRSLTYSGIAKAMAAQWGNLNQERKAA